MATAEPVKMDSKRRIVLGKRLREASGINAKDKLIAIPFHGGVIITSTRGKSFAGSLTGFHFDESAHEATTYIERLVKDADT